MWWQQEIKSSPNHIFVFDFFFFFLVFGNAHLYYSSDSFPYYEIDTNAKKQNIPQFTSQVLANTWQQKKITYTNLA